MLHIKSTSSASGADMSVVLLLVLLSGATAQHAAAAMASSGLPATVELIIRFATDVLEIQSSSAVDKAADVASASAAAAVVARGGDAFEQRRVATMAANSATAAARIATAVGVLANTVQQLGFTVLKEAPVTLVFQGTVLTLGTSSTGGDVQQLRKRLLQYALVEEVWIAGSVLLEEPAEESEREKNTAVMGSSAATAASAPAAETWTAAAGGAAAQTSAYATGLSSLHQEHPSLDGTGQLVCILDTGINYRLAAFGSCTLIGQPSNGCKVAVGYDFVGDQFNGTSDVLPVEDMDPMDCYGHGTQVASVAATLNGVASGALLGAYRVFGCTGFSSDALIIRAIDRAVRDGCHIINLSASSGSGFAERSPYNDVMKGAWDRGVIVTKSAGNSGVAGNYFDADVAVAAGALTVGSVGVTSTAAALRVDASYFSSFGPHPGLELSPHVCAPGAVMPVLDQTGAYKRGSGTSYAAPYVSGVLALWRQYKQQAAPSNVKGSTADASRGANYGTLITQEEIIRGLVHTAAGVRTAGESLLEPVARCGAGVIQADALFNNKLRIEPLMLLLPSNVKRAYSTRISVTWEGGIPPTVEGNLTSTIRYDVMHQPAFSVDLRNGWFGTNYFQTRSSAVVNVTMSPSRLVLQPGVKNSATIKVRFSLPPQLQATPLLYSGLIQLVPFIPPLITPSGGTNTRGASGGSTRVVAGNATQLGTGSSTVTSTDNSEGNFASDANSSVSTDGGVTNTNDQLGETTNSTQDWFLIHQWYSQLVPLVIPYQGYSQSYSALPIMAQDVPMNNSRAATTDSLRFTKALCYAPNSTTYMIGWIMDRYAGLPQVCTGGFNDGQGNSTSLAVSLAVLQASPRCSLRITLAPQVPMSWLYVDVLNAKGVKLGSIPAVDTSTKGSRVYALEAWSWCINFNGTYTAASGAATTVQTGQQYKLQAWAEGPVCTADKARGIKPRREKVEIKGAFLMVA